MKRTRIKRVSDKKRVEMVARKACMEVVRARDQGCRARSVAPGACFGPFDGHEPLPRSRGGDPTDPEQVILVCRGHHEWIHAHPALSKPLGLLI